MNAHATDDQLIDYLHGELPPADDALLHAHLAACTACRSRVDEEAALGDWLRSATPELEFPSLVKARVWEAVRRETPTLADRLRTLLRPAVAVPIAAVLALAVAAGLPALHGGSASPAVAAAYYLDEHQAESQANPLSERAPATFGSGERSTTPAPAIIDQADAAELDPALDAGS